MSRKIKKYQQGGYSITGYRNDSPDKNNAYNIIPSGRISMSNVSHPVFGVDEVGNSQMLMPGGEYQFQGTKVLELPIKDNNNMKKMKQGPLMKMGGAASGHPNQFWDGEKWVSTAGDSGTYNNGVYFAMGGQHSNYSQQGGPTFPIGGAAPIFAQGGYPVMPFAMYPGTGQGGGMLEEYANEHMQMGGVPGAMLVNPFAMNPGPGAGGGMLEDYADEENGNGLMMKRGGAVHHKGKGAGKKLSPQQMQMMMMAMQQAAQQQGQGQGQPQPQQQMMMQPQQGGQPMSPQDQQMMAMQQQQQQQQQAPQQMQQPGMKHGGIHINPANKGKFNATKKATGKTTEELTHSSNPLTRKRAIFAQNASHWNKKQYGGESGTMLYDNQGNVFAQGGVVNPYHPLAKFMQTGGFGPDGRDVNNETTIPTGAPQSSYSFDPANTGVYNQPTPQSQPSWAYNKDNTPMSDEQMNNNLKNGPHQQGPNWNQKARMWGAFGQAQLGNGLAIGAAYNNMRDERNNQAYTRSLGTSDNISKMNQPGGYGDYNQYGQFRPNQNTPTQAGAFYPGMQMGGMYTPGSEHELDDHEIARLKSLGYKIQMV